MILFVDDEKMYSESYVEALEEAGYEIRFELLIDEGLNFFKDNISKLDLVILDVMFSITGKLPPEIDRTKIKRGLRAGREILRAMNEIPGGKEIPKIFLTNILDEEFHKAFRNSSEVKACLRKRDISTIKLVEIVTKILRK